MQVTTHSAGGSHVAARQMNTEIVCECVCVCVHSFLDSGVLHLRLSINVTVTPYCGQCTHSSARRLDLLLFSVSQIDTEGKFVDQSR